MYEIKPWENQKLEVKLFELTRKCQQLLNFERKTLVQALYLFFSLLPIHPPTHPCLSELPGFSGAADSVAGEASGTAAWGYMQDTVWFIWPFEGVNKGPKPF